MYNDLKNLVSSLVQLKDLQSDLHQHTKYSDGVYTLPECAQAAKLFGFSSIGISDHSRSLGIAGGLQLEDLDTFLRDCKDTEQSIGIRIFSGTEMEVKVDGTVDWDEEIRNKFDYVIAALHTKPGTNTVERILKVMEMPQVLGIAHPSGRSFHNQRPIADCDWDRIFKKAVETKTFLEINAQSDRLDLPSDLVIRAKNVGAKFMINSDRHGYYWNNLEEYGIPIAHKAGLTPKDVLNTRDLTKFGKLNKEELYVL